MSPIIIISTLAVYLALLFWVAKKADRERFSLSSWSRHPLVYMLALGVYCTSWTFYGLVGTAASRGWYYLPILLGPVLAFTFGFPLLRRIAGICRQENIHSIADFIASRYGKRQSVAIVVTLIMLVATIPYIALQLKAVTHAILFSVNNIAFASQDVTLLTAVIMTLFTLLFGANRLDVANYHSGIMVAIAMESIVKVVALLAIAGLALTMSSGFDLDHPNNFANQVFLESTITPSFWVLTLISACSIICLPRMFQVIFVECLSEKHMNYGRKGFTVYLIATALAVFVIAWVGNQVLYGSDVMSDTYVLALPLMQENRVLSILAFLGGFSAATAMIIVASLTLSQMLSNDVILPLLIRAQKTRSPLPDYSRALIFTRRATVVAVIAMAWAYQHSFAENVALTEIGLIAFALVAQLAPAIIFGIYWHRCNAVGVFAGLGCGTALWFFTLMVPLLCQAGYIDGELLTEGLFGWSTLRPEFLFGFEYSDAYTRGVVLSLCVNVVVLYLVSTLDKHHLHDRIQAVVFTNRERVKQKSTVRELLINRVDVTALLNQFLGESATSRLLENEPKDETVFVSGELLEHAEQALSGVIGVASTRAMLASLSSGESLAVEDVVNIFEETTRTLQFNQELLFASFESISSAISVVNTELRIVAWNKRYEQMFNYPPGMLRVGRHVADLVRFNSERGILGAGSVEQHIQTRLQHLTDGRSYRVVRTHNQGVIEIKGRPLPKGGYVTTYDDISEFVNAQNELEQANLNLEQRVRERTEEIQHINESLREEIGKRKKTEVELIKAKAAAESANENKTQFLATASHDILQPLNAANLYASALLEKPGLNEDLSETLHHLHNAIGSAESIISNLLEISRLDTGALKPQIRSFPLSEILEPLANEFRVQTHEEVAFHWQHTSVWVESDPKYLRRILQNFLSNAVKYTRKGRILLGSRWRGNVVEVCVYDDGPGISSAHQKRIFDDFYRINSDVDGAGLGLGIAKRFSHLLDHEIDLHSKDGKGSMFSIKVPVCSRNVDQLQEVTHSGISSGVEGIRVFYVDDEENNIHALGALMNNWGCDLRSASDVSSAESYAAENPAPDVILVDYQLGLELNGLQLAERLRYTWGEISVCVVSGAPDEMLTEGLRQYNYDFLRKPIKPSKLRALLETYAQKKSPTSVRSSHQE